MCTNNYVGDVSEYSMLDLDFIFDHIFKTRQ